MRDGARDMAGWIAGRYGYSPWESRRWTAAAHSLEGLSRVPRACLAVSSLCPRCSTGSVRHAGDREETRRVDKRGGPAHDPTASRSGDAPRPRDIPLWLERLVRQRDGWQCSFPGCGAVRFLKSHHMWHWEDGGPTDLPNLVTVCHAHHKLVHGFGWRVSLNGAMPEWFRPDSGRFDPGPDPPQQLRVGAPDPSAA